MRVILDSHSNICCGPESTLFLPRRLESERVRELAARFDMEPEMVEALRVRSASQAEFIDSFFARYCEQAGKARWAEKTPRNVEVLPFVFDHFPQARFLHIIRDGRDTVCSLRTHPRHGLRNGELVELGTWKPIDVCARRWVRDVGRGFARRGDPRYREIRYEDLVERPRPTLQALFEWLEEPWDDKVLAFSQIEGSSRDVSRFPQNPEATQPIYQSANGRWRTDLSPSDSETLKRIAGDLLIELGYADDRSWTPEDGAGVRPKKG